MTNHKNRSALWDALLDADYQKRYWHLKANKFTYWDRRLQILLAISSSAAVLTALSDLKWIMLWKFLSFITALIAIALPFFNLSRRSIEMSSISSLYHELEIAYDSLWRKFDESSLSDNKFDGLFNELKVKELEIGKKIYDLTNDDKKLQLLCYNQVVQSRRQENDN